MLELVIHRHRLAAALAAAMLCACSTAPLPTAVGEGAVREAPAAKASPPRRAMWMWTYPYPPVAAVLRFAREHRVQDIFLTVSTNGKAVQSPREIAAFSRAAHAAGARIYALNGNPNWITDPKVVVAWENAVLATHAFDGLHLDAEPNEVPGWKGYGEPGAAAADAPIIEKMYAMVAALRANSPQTRLEIDVEFADAAMTAKLGYPSDGYGSFGEALVALTDELTVMSYRTTVAGPNGIAAISAPMLALAAKHGKPMRLAIETAKDPYTNDTFCGKPEAAVERAFAAIDAAEAGAPAYAGTSVEDYISWAALPRCIAG